MENLKNYESDSDDQEYPDDDHSVDCVVGRNDQSHHLLVNRVKGDNTPKSTELCNFLGLETGSRKNSYTSSDLLTQEKCRKVVPTCFGDVEVPNGDFWKDFLPEYGSSATVQQTNHGEYHRLQTGETQAQVGEARALIGETNLQRGKKAIESSPVSGQNWKFVKRYSECVSEEDSCGHLFKGKRIRHNEIQDDLNKPSCNSTGFLQKESQMLSANRYSEHLLSAKGHPQYSETLLCANRHPQYSETLLCANRHARYSELPGDCIKSHESHKQPVGASNNSHESPKLTVGASQKRNIYYVHSKISPFINVKAVSKCPGRVTDTWPAHAGVVNRIAWSCPNFSHLILSAGMDACVRIWNVWSTLDRCVTTLSGHKKAVRHVEWCHGGRRVLSCSYDRTAQVTDVETGNLIGQYEHMGFVTSGRMHPSNPNVFVTGTENMILKWDVRAPQAPVKSFTYKDKFGQVQDLLFINEDQELVSCCELVSRDSADRTIMVWDLRTGTVLSNQIFQERYTCTRLKLHPNKSLFMAQSHAGYVAMFSTTTPYKIDKSKRYEGHKTHGYSVGFDLSPDGAFVYSGSAENGIHCYHQQSGRLIKRLTGSNMVDIITDVACHPVLPSVLAACTWGGSINLWI